MYPAGYILDMEYKLTSIKKFDKWLNKLKDQSTKRKILSRLDYISFSGNLGDHKQISQNLYELRFFFGGGIRVYFTIRDKKIVLLLAGGDKSSQEKDIKQALKLIQD